MDKECTRSAKQRVIEERRELIIRHDALEKDIHGIVFGTLHRKEQRRQKKQLHIMKQYANVLFARLENWN